MASVFQPSPRQAAVHNEFDRIDPYRLPAWRWNKAKALVRHGHQPDEDSHDSWIWRAYTFILKKRGAECPVKIENACWNKTVRAGLKIKRDASLEKAVLEARLLAGESYPQIKQRCGLSVRVIKTYEKLFFDFRDRQHIKSWICRFAIGYEEGRVRNLPAFVRKLGYFAGGEFLELALPAVRHMSLHPSLRGADTDNMDRLELVLRGTFALEVCDDADRNRLLLLRQHTRLLGEEKKAQPGRIELERQHVERIVRAGMDRVWNQRAWDSADHAVETTGGRVVPASGAVACM